MQKRVLQNSRIEQFITFIWKRMIIILHVYYCMQFKVYSVPYLYYVKTPTTTQRKIGNSFTHTFTNPSNSKPTQYI